MWRNRSGADRPGEHRDGEGELYRRPTRGGVEQGGDAARVQRAMSRAPGDVDVDGLQRSAGHPGERRVDRVGRETAEGDLQEACPDPAPPAGEKASARGGAGAAEAGEDLEEQVVRECADAVHPALGPCQTARPGRRRATASAYHRGPTPKARAASSVSLCESLQRHFHTIGADRLTHFESQEEKLRLLLHQWRKPERLKFYEARRLPLRRNIGFL